MTLDTTTAEGRGLPDTTAEGRGLPDTTAEGRGLPDTTAEGRGLPDTTGGRRGPSAGIELPDRPHGPVAPDTHPVELRRLALEEAQHEACDPLSVQVLMWLVRASGAILGSQADALRDVDLSTSAFNVLMALRNTPGNVLEPCDIADRLLVTRPSVTGLLDTLEGKGLIERRPHPQDRRRRLVHLTDSAHELLNANLGVHYADLDRHFADLSVDERMQLVTLLRRIEGAVPGPLRDEDHRQADPDAA
jgi:DNA-binding MarR family transcriptional regulator